MPTLAQDLPESIDRLLLDGAKGLYSDILSLVEERLRVGALIIADNAEWTPEYLARVRSPDQGYMIVKEEREIHEGTSHLGMSALIGLTGRKPKRPEH